MSQIPIEITTLCLTSYHVITERTALESNALAIITPLQSPHYLPYKIGLTCKNGYIIRINI